MSKKTLPSNGRLHTKAKKEECMGLIEILELFRKEDEDEVLLN